MAQINMLLQALEYLRETGLQAIKMIENEEAWEYKISSTEFSIRETYHHAIKCLFEDAGNWFLNDPQPFESSGDPTADLNKSIDRMLETIKDFSDEKLSEDFTFPWGGDTKISGAIIQTLFHTAEHFGQLRNRVGTFRRNK